MGNINKEKTYDNGSFKEFEDLKSGEIVRIFTAENNCFTADPHKNELNTLLRSIYCAQNCLISVQADGITKMYDPASLYPKRETTPTLADRLLNIDGLVTADLNMKRFKDRASTKYRSVIAVYVPSDARYLPTLEPTYIISAGNNCDLWLYCFGFNIQKSYKAYETMLCDYLRKSVGYAAPADSFVLPYTGNKDYDPVIVHASEHYNFDTFKALLKAYSKGDDTKHSHPLRANTSQQIMAARMSYSRRPSAPHKKHSQFYKKKYDAIDLCRLLKGDLRGCEYNYVYLMTNNEMFMGLNCRDKNAVRSFANYVNSFLTKPLKLDEIEEIAVKVAIQGRKNYGYEKWGSYLPLYELSCPRACYDAKKIEAINENKAHNARVSRKLKKAHKVARIKKRITLAAAECFDGKGFNISAIARKTGYARGTVRKYLEMCIEAVIARIKDAFHSAVLPVFEAGSFVDYLLDPATGEIVTVTG